MSIIYTFQKAKSIIRYTLALVLGVLTFVKSRNHEIIHFSTKFLQKSTKFLDFQDAAKTGYIINKCYQIFGRRLALSKEGNPL